MNRSALVQLAPKSTRQFVPPEPKHLGLINLDFHQQSTLLPKGVSVYGENVLLPFERHAPSQYGCCVYVSLPDCTRTVPVVVLRPWRQVPLPCVSSQHPFWEESLSGILAAERHLRSTSFDLNGAVAAARAWVRNEKVDNFANKRGSLVLVGSDMMIVCPPAVLVPPPPSAPANVIPFRVPQTIAFGAERLEIPSAAA